MPEIGTTGDKVSMQVIRRGFYEEISLVRLQPKNSTESQSDKKRNFLDKLFATTLAVPKKPFYPLELADSIVYGRKIWEQMLPQIPKGKNEKEKIQLADVLITTSLAHISETKPSTRNKSLALSPRAGKDNADLLYLIPLDQSVGILLAAADPNIAQALLNGKAERDNFQEKIDSQSVAIEAFALLPRNDRRNMFQNMVNQQPSLTEKFLNLIVASWNYPSSLFCAPFLIQQNLNNGLAAEKINEFQQDWNTLRLIVESRST